MWSRITSKLSSLGLTPRSRVARFTAYFAGVEAVLLLLQWVFQRAGAAAIAASLAQWTNFLGFVLAVLLVFLALRWFRSHVMWSVRNRLIVTYLFIGGVPITLVLLMALISAYFLAGRFSAYIAM